ncbi:MAG: hypothetical protein ABII82_13350 [Verrucomicrobiota bacterium]
MSAAPIPLPRLADRALVTVLDRRETSGWDGDLDPERRPVKARGKDGAVLPVRWWPTLPIGEALARRWTTDAHLVCYHTATDGEVRPTCPRTNKAALDSGALAAVGAVLRLGVVLVDVDAPDHAATPEWREDQARLREALPPGLRAGMGGYATRGGYRLVWTLPEALTPDAFETIAARLHATLAGHGIEADPACKDWTRLYRLPFVVRDGDPQRWPADLARLGAAPLPVEALAELPEPTPPVWTPPPRPRTDGGTSPWGRAVLDGECSELREAAHGGRNVAWNLAVHAVARVVAGGEVDAAEAEAELWPAVQAAAASGPTMTAAELRRTFDSAWQAGLREPRRAPERPRTPLEVVRRTTATARSSEPPAPLLRRLWCALADAPWPPGAGRWSEDLGVCPDVPWCLGCRDWSAPEVRELLAEADSAELVRAGLATAAEGLLPPLRAALAGDAVLGVPEWLPGASEPAWWRWRVLTGSLTGRWYTMAATSTPLLTNACWWAISAPASTLSDRFARQLASTPKPGILL